MKAAKNVGRISYIKLFKLLLDKKMKKGDLCAIARVSHSSVSKLEKAKT